MKPRRILYWAGLMILGSIYVTAGVIKVVDPKAFARAILDYRMMPETLVPLLAVMLPWWEFMAGGLAIVGWLRRGALAVLAGLSATFAAVGILTMSRGLSPECGCFGGLSERVGAGSVTFELLLAIIALLLLRWQKNDVLRTDAQK